MIFNLLALSLSIAWLFIVMKSAMQNNTQTFLRLLAWELENNTMLLFPLSLIHI